MIGAPSVTATILPGGAGNHAGGACKESDMIVKLDLTGKQYLALLGALLRDVNFYEMPRMPAGPTDRTASAKIVSTKTTHVSPHRGLPMHEVTLEIEEYQQLPEVQHPLTRNGEKTPRSVLENIFDAIELYPRCR